VHLVGFIIKKFVTMHGHMNVKISQVTFNMISSSKSVFTVSPIIHI